MSILKIGNRSPHRYEVEKTENEEHIGIPGLKRSPLFYQDIKRIPTASHGKGIYIYDTNGKRYLDGCSGAISANLGHGNERIIEAATRQMKKIAFTYRNQFENIPANALAELLVQLSPPELNRVFFVNSGSEAVESAIKLARQYWWTLGKRGKSEIISRRPSYHGATLGALSVTGYAPLNIPYYPMLTKSAKVAAPFCYHCPLGKKYPECGVDCAVDLERQVNNLGADNIAAFVAEPIGGSSTGAAVPPEEYFSIIEKICHDNEILLIIDDVMTGCGRTGTFYGYEHWDITPDIVASSKGLSGGYTPIGAIITSDTIVDKILESGGFLHGHTYSGNPLSTAITLEVLRTIIDENLVENSRTMGTYLHEKLHELKARYNVIGDIRGRGLFAGVEFVRDRKKRESFPANWYVTFETTLIARNLGLLVYPRRSMAGLSGDHILIAPPLIIDKKGVDELISLFDQTLLELTKLLDSYLAEEAKSFVDETIKRYEQSDSVPDYALGDLKKAKKHKDVNVTGVMTQEDFVQAETGENQDKDNQ